jgi:hypothetical protein
MIERHELNGFSEVETKEIIDAFEFNLRLSGEENKPHPIHEFKFIPRSIPFFFKDPDTEIVCRAVRTFDNGQVFVEELWHKDVPEHLRRKRHINIWQWDKKVQLPTQEEIDAFVFPTLK